MAVSVTATQVDDASGWSETPPTGTAPDGSGHAGWNNPAGDPDWIPDVNYNRRFLLTCTGDAGEVGSIVNWEIFDGTVVPFVDDASAVTVQATGGTYTAATAPAFVNDRTTRTLWVRNATAADGGAPYYDDTGKKWVSTLRANGPRVVVELPMYAGFNTTDAVQETFEIVAYLPGSFGAPAAQTSVTVSNPDVGDLG